MDATIQTIFSDHFPAYRETHKVAYHKHKAVQAIIEAAPPGWEATCSAAPMGMSSRSGITPVNTVPVPSAVPFRPNVGSIHKRPGY